MQFLYDAPYYKVIRITGPQHNLLGLSLGHSESIEISDLASSEPHENTIKSDDVLTQVITGLKEINHQLQSNYQINKVQFVATDTPNKDVYRDLTKELIFRLHNNQDFISLSKQRPDINKTNT